MIFIQYRNVCMYKYLTLFSSGVAEVMFATAYQTASPSDVQLTPPGGVVIFSPGQTQASIAVFVRDDATPEEQEQLMLSLVSVLGDAVLDNPTQVLLEIELSDDPNGLFAFAVDSQMVGVEEGETVQLT